MLDAACPGQVFTSPTPDQMIAAMAAVDGGAGCLLIVKNYEGDVMNFDMAAARGVQATRYLTGSYVTSLDMAGCSLTVTLLDDELEQLWRAPVHTAGLRW
jgi:dihydroxyacetone kinase